MLGVDLLILITLGTQIQQFSRLLDAVESCDTHERIVVQAGHSTYESDKMEIHGFIDMDEMEKLVGEARIVVTHGGTGSIVGALKKKKRVIACARLKKYGEHLDDHQLEIVKTFTDNGYILAFTEGDDFSSLLKQAESFEPKAYTSNSEQFIKKLEEKIDSFFKN